MILLLKCYYTSAKTRYSSKALAGWREIRGPVYVGQLCQGITRKLKQCLTWKLNCFSIHWFCLV